MRTSAQEFSSNISDFYQEVSSEFQSQIDGGTSPAILDYASKKASFEAKGYVTAAEKAQLQAIRAKASFNVYAQKSVEWKAKAAVAGNIQARDMWTKMAADYKGLVQKYSSMNATEYSSYVKNTLKFNMLNFMSRGLAIAGFAYSAYEMTDAYINKNWDQLGSVSMGVLGAIGAGLLVTASTPIWLAVSMGVAGSWIAQLLWDISDGGTAGEWWGNFISDLVNTKFSIGEAMFYDPLTFDLNGDGIKTLALNGKNSVLFDHNGDGVKTASGWVSPDDGFLVRDINQNGTIDTGKELFGDSTVLSDGTTAADGFAALADMDTNADGVIDANDAAFSELRIWRDANSDGVTQPGELLTLNQAGIASINTAYNGTRIAQDGNTISALGSYTKTDGTSSTLGSITSVGNLNLAGSTFYSAFKTPVTLTPQAKTLPTMQGSGRVRDLREAVSLDTDAGRALAAALTHYSTLTTRKDQRAALDDLLLKWSDTSGMPTMIDRALAA